MGVDCPCHLETRSKTVHAESCIQGDGVPALFMHTDIATYTDIVSLFIVGVVVCFTFICYRSVK